MSLNDCEYARTHSTHVFLIKMYNSKSLWVWSEAYAYDTIMSYKTIQVHVHPY